MHDYPHLALFNARTRQAVKRAARRAGRDHGTSHHPTAGARGVHAPCDGRM